MMRAFFLSLLIIFTSLLEAREINLDKLIQKATSSHKHLFVFLHKTDCGYCEGMKEFTLQNEIIHDFIEKHFIYEHINISKKDTIYYQDFVGSGREFAREIGYEFYPTSLFFDEKGELILAEAGYRDTPQEPNEKRFYRILNFIQSKAYKHIYIADYKFQVDKEFE